MLYLKNIMQKFDQRFNLQGSKNNPKEEFLRFKTRILNDIKGIDQYVTKNSVSKFCKFLGIQENWHQTYMGDTLSQNIIKSFTNEENDIKFYKLLQILLSLNIPLRSSGFSQSYTAVFSKHILYQKIKDSIELSNINLAIIMLDNEEVVLYPRGEEKLDDKLVNKVMSFLDEKSNKHFVDALQLYQVKNYIQSAEQLRRALKEFLKYKLTNDKGLKANIEIIQKTLKEKKAGAQIRNIISQIFNYLDQYFNENTKHNDGELEEYDNEFFIYQIGLLLRYISKVIK